MEAPVIVCPAGDPAVTGNVDAGQDYATITGGGVVIPETGFGTAGTIATDNADNVGLGVVQITRELKVYGPPHAGSNTVDVPDSCTSTLGVTDTANCILTPTTDFGVTDGSCEDVDSDTATCTYVVGSYSTVSDLTDDTRFPIGLSEVLYTAVDAEGNEQSCSINVRVIDLEPPVIDLNSCVDVSATTDLDAAYAMVDPCAWADMSGTDAEDQVECAAAGSSCTYSADSCQGDGYTGDLVFPTIDATDNSGPHKIHIVPTVGGDPVTDTTEFEIGDTTVTFTVSDEASTPNTVSCTIVVTVVDDQPPQITCPDDITDAVTDPGEAYASSGGRGITTPEQRTRLVGNNNLGSLAQDNSDGHAAYGGSSGDGVAGISVYLVQNAGQATETLVPVDSTTPYPIGTNEIRYTAVDHAGNEDSCSISLTVSDTQDPVINEDTCTASFAVSDTDASFSTTDGTVVLPTVQATDNHVVQVTPSLVEQCVVVPGTSQEESIAATTCDLSNAACTVATGSGNCIYELGTTVVDGTTEFLIGQTTLTLTAMDDATPPNTDVCSVVVTVEDGQPPAITCPENVDGVTMAGQSYATRIDGVTLSSTADLATDNSDPVYGGSPGDGVSMVREELVLSGGGRIEVDDTTQFGIGSSTIVYTAFDRHSTPNQADCSITVEVVDDQPPVIDAVAVLEDGRVACADFSTPTDLDVAYATVGGSSDFFPDIGAATTDNSGSFTISAETDSGVVVVGDGADTDFQFTLDPAGTVVTFTASDAAAGSDTCTLTVFVVDDQPPDIVCPAPITDAETDAGAATASVVGGGVSIQYISDAAYVAGTPGLATDNTDPFHAGGGPGAAIASISVFVIRENGVREPVTVDTQFGIGTSTIVYVAEDAAHNEAECDMSLTVLDLEPPVLGAVGDCSAADVDDKTTDPGQPFGTYASLDTIKPPVTDNSGLAVSLVPSVDGVTIDEYYQFGYAAPTQVTWTATDDAGVVASCTTTVTVIDNEAPVLGHGGDCSAWDMTISASFDQDWFTSCSFNSGTGQMDCSADSSIIDPDGNPPIYGRVLLPNIPVSDNSGESLDDESTISAIAVSGGADPSGVHACIGCSDGVTVYNRDPLPGGHAIPHVVLFDVPGRTSQASAVYTIEYTVADSSAGVSGGSAPGSCTVRVTVVEEDDCVADNNRCGPHSVGCIDLAATSFGLHESEANRIYYPTETFLGTIDRGDGSSHVTFSTEVEWRDYYDTYAAGSGTNPLHENLRPGYQCICEHGWEGDDCRTDTDECLAGSFLCTANEPCNGPCENAAACRDSNSVLEAGQLAIPANAYRCDCDFGFSGINCDMYNECISDPCYQLTTSPPATVETTDKFLCPVAMICTDPDHTTTDDYICSCPACDDAMFSSPNVATLATYLESHSGLRSFISSQLNEQQEEATDAQQTCVMTDAKCAFTPTHLCPGGCAYTPPTCTGFRISVPSASCADVAAFESSGLEADCPTTDGCSFAPDTCAAREGCTDPTALNYDARAALDDGTCVSVVYGCMDPLAVNYDATATEYDPTGVNGELCRAGYCSITGLMPTCPDGCTGPVGGLCDCTPSPVVPWGCPNVGGAIQSILQYSASNPLDECASGSPCSNPGTRLCPLLAQRGMTPESCQDDRQSFMCNVGGDTVQPFTCHDPNPYWPGDFTCDCVYAHEDGFYANSASLQCGEDEVITGVSNYDLTRLVDTIPSLRTRICDVLGGPDDDCPDSYLTATGRRRL